LSFNGGNGKPIPGTQVWVHGEVVGPVMERRRFGFGKERNPC